MTASPWIAPGYLLVGGALASAYLGTLWLAVKRLPDARRPLTMLVGGFVLRTAGLAALLFLVTRRAPLSIALAIVGFVAMRTLVLHLVTRRGISWI